MAIERRVPVERAVTLRRFSRAFFPEPLDASELAEFYSDALSICRGTDLVRRMSGHLLAGAEDAFYFKGVLYGNRGTGKSTEIIRLLASQEIRSKFVSVVVDAVTDLNPRSFTVVDVLLVTIANLIEACEAKCRELGRAFNEAGTMHRDLQQALAPFFSVLQAKIQDTVTKGGTVEGSFFGLAKASVRIEGQRRTDVLQKPESLSELGRALDRYIAAIKVHLPEFEFLVVGENFDREQVSRGRLADTFIEFGGVFRDLQLNLLFTLPVPFVNAHRGALPFRRQNQYPIYDIPVCTAAHEADPDGCGALRRLVGMRADPALFDDDALNLVIRASGGDLSWLFSMIVLSAERARYRNEDFPDTPARILFNDAEGVVLEQFSMFRNEMGVDPDDPDDAPWPDKRAKLRAIYEDSPDADVPSSVLYHLLRRRAVLYFNGRGRYGVHPMAIEILREQLDGLDETFHYKGGGLDAIKPRAK